MILGELTRRPVLVEGGWTDYHGQRRFLGRLVTEGPMRLCAFTARERGFWYAKSGRIAAGDTEVDLLLHPNADGSAFQVVLRVGSMVSNGGRLGARRHVRIAETFPFETGTLADWAAPGGTGSPIRLLAVDAADIASRKGGIWGVKARLLDGLPAPLVPVLTRSRFGRVELDP
jgi:hypothetical protein